MTSPNWPAEVERQLAIQRQKQTRDEREELLASLTMQEIIDAVIALTRISADEFFGRYRQPQIWSARRIAVGLMRDLPRTPYSFPQIAAAMGRATHGAAQGQYAVWRNMGEQERKNWMQWAFHWIMDTRKENTR